MTFITELLKEMWHTTIRYKGVPVNLFGMPTFKPYSKRSMQNAVYRLGKKGYVRKCSDDGWELTALGKQHAKATLLFDYMPSPFEKSAPKDLLLMFDVPETQKKERDWLRKQLRDFGYVLVQKSAWVGPSPLPKEFTGRMKELGLKSHIKTFKLSKGYQE